MKNVSRIVVDKGGRRRRRMKGKWKQGSREGKMEKREEISITGLDKNDGWKRFRRDRMRRE